MRKLCCLLVLLLLLLNIYAQEKNLTSELLPNGWSLSPAGKSLPLGDLPLNMCIAPNKKYMVITNNGQSTQSLQLIDLKDNQILDIKEVGKSWLGLSFSKDSRFVYASGGNDNWVYKFMIINGKLMISDTIRLTKEKESVSISGIAIDDENKKLYVVTKGDNSLYILNTETKKVEKKVPLKGEAYTCILSASSDFLYISCWGCDGVIEFDTKKQEIINFIKVGDNPNDMAINNSGKLLFVANSNDNSVSVIDLKTREVIETLNAALFPNAPSGSTTNSVALNEENTTLYIANADNNCLAVFDVSEIGKSISKGFIPTGWYPTCVRVLNNVLYVANGKGMRSMANPNGPNPYQRKQKVTYQKGDSKKPKEVQYIGGLFKGTLSMIAEPNEKELATYSQQVYRNTPYLKNTIQANNDSTKNPILSKIKYVFYIIKENRTFDQVLSDMPGCNGDTSLLLFGQNVTPNQHALAKEFVLFDNFYVNGEVSADGHNWSLGAYATDYLEKTWPTSYGGRGGSYDAEGGKEIANNKNFLWDMCKISNVTYRTYGEFADNYKPNLPILKDHFCPYYTSWDESVRDTTRVAQWRREFDSLLLINQVPQLNTLRLINDHTQGLQFGKPSPNAHVADNDLATGLFIEHLSQSKIWNESVVFVLEDDAQNGPDHVDAHRSPLYIAGGCVKRNFKDNNMYSTTSILKTIELILGLPPMSQYDAAATSLWRCFTDSINYTPFKAIPTKINLNETNLALNKWQKLSESFDFGMEDRVEDAPFNEVLWWYVKGDDIPCPAPVHSAFLRVNNAIEEN